jgi:hypothetical protein
MLGMLNFNLAPPRGIDVDLTLTEDFARSPWSHVPYGMMIRINFEGLSKDAKQLGLTSA